MVALAVWSRSQLNPGKRGMGLFGTDPALLLRLSRIEKKLDALLERAGITIDEFDDEAYRELARNGRKIDAIKLYRERTGSGLAEAKAYIDAL